MAITTIKGQQVFDGTIDPSVDMLLPTSSYSASYVLAGPGSWKLDTANVVVVFDGNGSVINTGSFIDVEIPWNSYITDIIMMADQTGSFTFNIFKGTYASYPPTTASSICSASRPTIAANYKSYDSTLTNWITYIPSGSILRYYSDSCSSITRCSTILKLRKLT